MNEWVAVWVRDLVSSLSGKKGVWYLSSLDKKRSQSQKLKGSNLLCLLLTAQPSSGTFLTFSRPQVFHMEVSDPWLTGGRSCHASLTTWV